MSALPGEQWLLDAVRVPAASDAADVLQVASDGTGSLPMVVAAAVVSAWLAVRRRRFEAALPLAAVLLVALLTPVLKPLIERSRPDGALLTAGASFYSLPAGHAATSAALVVGLLVTAGLTGRRRAWAIAAGAAVLLALGAVQLALARHYPSDILAGWLLGAAVAFVIVNLPVRKSGSDRSRS